MKTLRIVSLGLCLSFYTSGLGDPADCQENCARKLNEMMAGCRSILSGQPYGGFPGGGYGGVEAMYTAYEACLNEANQHMISCFNSCP